jgi:hypothetical protein
VGESLFQAGFKLRLKEDAEHRFVTEETLKAFSR